MQPSLKLLSVNIGKRSRIVVGQEAVDTGIFKEPVGAPVQVSALGLESDAVVNKKYHGGPDQALYLYSEADYRWWAGQLGRELAPGLYGENLTVSDFGTATPRIGDRYRIGEVLLEVTAPRIPCSVFAAKMGDPAFAKTFAKARRPGLYVRVLETGMLRAGMAMELIPAAPENPEVLELFDFWLGKERDPKMAKRFLASPVAERDRSNLEELVRKSG